MDPVTGLVILSDFKLELGVYNDEVLPLMKFGHVRLGVEASTDTFDLNHEYILQGIDYEFVSWYLCECGEGFQSFHSAEIHFLERLVREVSNENDIGMGNATEVVDQMEVADQMEAVNQMEAMNQKEAVTQVEAVNQIEAVYQNEDEVETWDATDDDDDDTCHEIEDGVNRCAKSLKLWKTNRNAKKIMIAIFLKHGVRHTFNYMKECSVELGIKKSTIRHYRYCAEYNRRETEKKYKDWIANNMDEVNDFHKTMLKRSKEIQNPKIVEAKPRVSPGSAIVVLESLDNDIVEKLMQGKRVRVEHGCLKVISGKQDPHTSPQEHQRINFHGESAREIMKVIFMEYGFNLSFDYMQLCANEFGIELRSIKNYRSLVKSGKVDRNPRSIVKELANSLHEKVEKILNYKIYEGPRTAHEIINMLNNNSQKLHHAPVWKSIGKYTFKTERLIMEALFGMIGLDVGPNYRKQCANHLQVTQIRITYWWEWARLYPPSTEGKRYGAEMTDKIREAAKKLHETVLKSMGGKMDFASTNTLPSWKLVTIGLFQMRGFNFENKYQSACAKILGITERTFQEFVKSVKWRHENNEGLKELLALVSDEVKKDSKKLDSDVIHKLED